MTSAAPIEDFLEAITAQLDRTQDALRLKAVNRPLTFALKDFSVALSVFVEMDQQGTVRLRPSGPNEEGASTINITFTTITRPMIEENTISMEQTASPSLQEAGLAPEESQRLERLGVRNMAQLRRLQEQSDDESVARFSGVDVGRLRRALHNAGPRIDYVDIGAGRRTSVPREPGSPPARVTVPPSQSRLRLGGQGMIDRDRAARARFGSSLLPTRSASHAHLDVELPADLAAGTLEIELPDGRITAIELVPEDAPVSGSNGAADRWATPAAEETP